MSEGAIQPIGREEAKNYNPKFQKNNGKAANQTDNSGNVIFRSKAPYFFEEILVISKL